MVIELRANGVNIEGGTILYRPDGRQVQLLAVGAVTQQTDGTDGILSADLGLGSLNHYKVCKLRGYVPRDGLTVNHLSIS